jgi:dolichyl-diphosphooligosaccharide--protein glycosyltransferase
VKDFARVERQSFNWAIFGGVSLGATLFAWQGYTYVLAAIVAFLVIALVVERLRKHDTFGAYIVTLIVGTIGFAMAMPYYYVQGEFGYWFTLPLMIFYGALLALLPFIALRDTPWLFSMGVLLASVGGAAGALFVYNKGEFNALITGQGYFVKNLIYSTVAEAQAPSFDSLIVSYGPVTFFLAFLGLGIFCYFLYKYKFKREHLFMVVLGVLGIYLPIEAAKLFLIGTPLFAILPAMVLLLALDRMGYPEMRRTASSLGDKGGRMFALRKSLKARHFLIILIAIAVLLPNVWYAVDAAVPYNSKAQYNEQIYNTLPPALRTSASQASSFYLGAAGIDTDTPSQYDENGYNWLATQDTQVIPADRPAFISWWDYGFQAVDEGQHPAVADNFQDGIVPSGHFLLSQNESQAIAVLCTDLLVTEQMVSGKQYLPAQLNSELKADGLNITTLHNYLVNSSKDITLVEANPQTYGPVNSANLDGPNSVYYTTVVYIASALPESGVVNLYQTLQSYTGWDIRYAMSDSRLFPVSGSSTGIYYAPVDLTDGVIGSGGIPTYYFTVTVTGSDGNTYPLGEVPNGVQEVSSNINYNPAFYQSMIYHTFVGYNGTQVGAGSGVPGISGSSLAQYPVEPGWMMQHFVLGYRTAYYCPLKNYTSGCFSAVSLAQALGYQKAGTGTVDTSAADYYNGGETILEYYPGATITGAVTLPDGTPVPGVHVTILDQYGIPHMVSTTNQQGAYSLIAPAGNDTIAASYGAVSGLTQTGSTELTTVNITISQAMAYTYPAPPIRIPIVLKPGTLDGTVYWNLANTSSYDSDQDTVVTGAPVTVSNGPNFNETVLSDLTGTYVFNALSPGVYNVSMKEGTGTFSFGTVTISSGKTSNHDLGLNETKISGSVTYANGAAADNAKVTLVASTHVTTIAYTGSAGTFVFGALPPATYVVSASLNGETSQSISTTITQLGENVTYTLVLSTPAYASVKVSYGNLPLSNMAVRFTPIVGISNNSVFAQTGVDGIAKARLMAGLWSVYALGAVNGTWLAGLENIRIVNGTNYATLQASGVQSLSGHVYSSVGGTPQSGASLIIQSSSGAIMQATTNATGAYDLLLPQDTYTVIATYTSTGTVPTVAAVGSAFVRGTTILDLGLTSAVFYSTEVGYRAYSGAFVPLPDAMVNITFNGATVHLVADAGGQANVTLPTETTSFALTASLYGFAQNQTSFPNQEGLLKDTTILLSPTPIGVAMSIVYVGERCSPCNAPTVNFTAVSSSALNESVVATLQNGTYVAHAMLRPGTYQISGYASISGGIWGPAGNLTFSIPIGSAPIQLPLASFYPQNAYYGHLNISGGRQPAFLGQATVRLANPIDNLTLTGSSFTNQTEPFRAPQGTYTLWVVAENGTSQYAYFGNVSLNGSGGPVRPVTLRPASTLTVSFSSTQAASVNFPINVTVFNASQASHGPIVSFSTTSSSGLSVTMPNGSYAMNVNETELLNISGILQHITLTATNWQCPLNFTIGSCNVALASRSAQTLVRGTAALPGSSIPVAGTVTAIPLGSGYRTGTTVPVSSGTFTLSLLPGTYTIYALLNGNGVPEMNVTQVTIPYTSQGYQLSLAMQPGWTESVTVIAPSGVTPSSATWLNVTRNGTYENFSMGAVPVGTPYQMVLPLGTWNLQAQSYANPYGKPVGLSAMTNVTIYSSNGAVNLQLVPHWSKTVSMTVVGPTSANVASGGNVTFSFVANNTGNGIENLRFKGAPGTWGFTFYPANATLLPSGPSSVSVEVLISVPTTALTTGSTGSLDTVLEDTGAIISTASISVHVAPVHGISVTKVSSSDQVGNHTITLGFEVAANGNTLEDVAMSVLNQGQLSQYGWACTLSQQSFPGLTPGNPAVQATVTLSARLPGAILPGNVTLLAVDTSSPSVTSTLTIAVPSAQISVPGPLVVTGPNIGTALPDYLPYVTIAATVAPAAAILIFTFTRRWWKSRRWVRR